MWFKTLLLLAVVAAAIAAPGQSTDALAAPCDTTKCKLPKCRCFGTEIPGGFKPTEVPQLVTLTFDDAISDANYNYYQGAFSGKKNADGCPIGATYFVSHEYTDYSKLHALYSQGHEIALHSITHTTDLEYWRTATLEQLRDEFNGEREIISTFGKIPASSIQGIRMPFLQLSGNTSFSLLNKDNYTYDCSWPTQSYMKPPIWPYTLDYESNQDCLIGPCPNEAYPGTWVVPMIDWLDDDENFCAMVDACQVIKDRTTDGLVNFMKKNFNRHYEGNRAPFGFFVHAAWFNVNSTHFEAYKKFVDYLVSLPDVYIVNIKRVLEWVQNPSKLGNLTTSWPKCQPTQETNCEPVACNLKKGEEERRMTQCLPTCPRVYPWLGNPLGK